MLVLTRRVGDKIVFLCGGETVEMELTRNDNGSVRLAFEASEEVQIWRKELIDKSRAGGFVNRREIGR